MNPLLAALLLVLIALLGAQLTFARRTVPLGPRIFIAVGGPFIFLGFALGPHVSGLLTPEIVDQLTPLLALGLGWIGLLFGLQLDRTHLRQFPSRYLILAWLQAGLAFALVYVIGLLLLRAWSVAAPTPVLMAAAATACVSTPAAAALISNTYMARGPVSRLLFYVASLDGAIGLLALAVTHAVHHTGILEAGSSPLSFAEWLVTTTLLGCFFGILFLSLTRIRPGRQEFMLFLIGLVLFASGTAFYLSVSPLFVCMIAGVLIANLSPLRRRVYDALSEWEKPIYIMALLLAGALLRFGTWWILPLAVVYVAGRLLAKWLGGLMASRLIQLEFKVPTTFGLALAPQGGLSLAMAISFMLIYDPTGSGKAAVELFFAIVVIAVGLTDLLGPFLVRDTLERAGEVDRTLELEPQHTTLSANG